MVMKKQIETIDPSAKDALFRRLMFEDELNYLRKDNTITGFEVNVDQPDMLGYAIIAIQKHTILAYKSDLHEPVRLVLFPSMDKMNDPEFGLLDLLVERKVFSDDSFISPAIAEGRLEDVAKDLIPPYKTVEVSDEMAASMTRAMRESTFNHQPEMPRERQKQQTQQRETPVLARDVPPDDDIPMDVPFDAGDVPFDAPYDSFDEPPIDDPFEYGEPYSEPVEEHAPASSSNKIVPIAPKAIELHNQSFSSLSAVSDYVVMNMGVQPPLATNVITAALQSTTDSHTQIDVAVLLFVKLFNDNKI